VGLIPGGEGLHRTPCSLRNAACLLPLLGGLGPFESAGKLGALDTLRDNRCDGTLSFGVVRRAGNPHPVTPPLGLKGQEADTRPGEGETAFGIYLLEAAGGNWFPRFFTFVLDGRLRYSRLELTAIRPITHFDE